ncbi:hypothetical protein [Nitrospirillum sp. BR 11163]|uniref:hypothetical protein n=1 Tax=Nitrospirillum sp. BR 11163 TaxID=3104323 RepID=UPI002B001A62|nr:hypothetical protein [Nitrospirillum sp. BR 11163]MEA1676343.1 hypothetical protein [Nitrospirillum sp. BR 11163]
MRLVKILAAVGILYSLILQSAVAGSSDPGYVTGIAVNINGTFFFNSTGTRQQQPACANSGRYVINVSTLAGQSIMSSILSANMAHQKISVYGTGACTITNDVEDVAYITYVE